MTPPPERPGPPEAPPPILGSWRALYALVVGALVAQIVAYWLVTRAYA